LLEGMRGEGRTVEAEVGLDAERAGVVDKLVGAKLVGLGRQPGELGSDRPVLDGADAVLPVVVADKVWRREWEREARGRGTGGGRQSSAKGGDEWQQSDVLPPGHLECDKRRRALISFGKP
jgi:hypothetical protein